MQTDASASPAVKAAVENLLDLVIAFSNRLNLGSGNSHKPPSQDPNRKKKTRTAKGQRRKPGGQKGHKGNCLRKVDHPTEIEEIFVDRSSIPFGDYKRVGFETRQVFDMEISISVKEYRAEILVNEQGVEYMAEFPPGVTEPAQYGDLLKATSVYMSQFQLIPQDRVKDYFHDQVGIPLSKGSVGNFNVLAYNLLEGFEQGARSQLISSLRNHSDETGINVSGKRLWLHSLSNDQVTLFHPDEKRGQEAMDRMDILPHYKGILVHDHWKPYFGYDCVHALCNAHHLRELEFAHKECSQKWAKSMQNLLLAMKAAVEKAGGVFPKKKSDKYRRKYRRILKRAQAECPRDKDSRAQSKSRNLLERLEKFETETLRFMDDINVPFTNNLGENDIRMTKVQQKISGCFRSMEGAKIFCRVRSFLSTCRKNGVGPTEALNSLFQGQLPSFVT